MLKSLYNLVVNLITKIFKPAQINDFLKDGVISGSLVVTIGLFISNIFSYILQLFLGRNLSIMEYGEFSSLLSLAYVLFIPLNAVSISLVKLTSELKSNNENKVLGSLFLKLSRTMIIIGLIISGSVVLVKTFLVSYLNLDSYHLIYFYAAYLSASFLVIVPGAYLQGLLKFKRFSLFVSISSFIRFLFPFSLVILGLGVKGVFSGMALASVLTFFISFILLRKNLSDKGEVSEAPYYARIIKFGFPALLVGVGLTLLNNVDVILVKHFFSGEDAGIYSAVVTVGKVILFGAGAVAVVMFPQVSASHSKGLPYIGMFKKFAMLQLTIIVASVLVFVLFPGFIIRILFGSKFMSAIPLLPLFSLFMGLYVLIQFLSVFFLAVNKTSIYIVQISVAILQAVIINIFHNNLSQIIKINIFVGLLLLLSYFVILIKVLSNNSKALSRVR